MSEAPFPHCNSQVIHAPGECHYCDQYPQLQSARAASGGEFTPNAANGWSGNIAMRKGEPYTHMGAIIVPGADDERVLTDDAAQLRCGRPPAGWYCMKRGGHEGPCPTRARWWKRLWMAVK